MTSAPTPALPPIPEDLDKLSDREISALVTRYCAGEVAEGFDPVGWMNEGRFRDRAAAWAITPYATDANEAIRLLEAQFNHCTPEITPHKDGWVVVLWDRRNPPFTHLGQARTFARAAALALLRAAASQTPIATSAQKEGC